MKFWLCKKQTFYGRSGQRVPEGQPKAKSTLRSMDSKLFKRKWLKVVKGSVSYQCKLNIPRQNECKKIKKKHFELSLNSFIRKVCKSWPSQLLNKGNNRHRVPSGRWKSGVCRNLLVAQNVNIMYRLILALGDDHRTWFCLKSWLKEI